ncbi:MAG: amidohydrolase [Lachnospiraceae bacterium]|nr:amidohydrolase [Lachnospiraceae bacterium]
MEKLYYNGKIITMADTRPEAVLVCDGKIKRIGTLEAVKQAASRDADWIDLQGKCLMPSFIDSHSHIVMSGQMACFADLSDCKSLEDMVSILKKYMADRKVGRDGIVVGVGYDHNFLKERRHPDKFVLDRVSEDIPVMVLHVSAHLGCVNSVALKLSGINENTGNPEGGIIGRIGESSEPSGYMEEAGLALVQKVLGKKIHLDVSTVMSQMQKTYIEHGITTAQDGASTEADIKLLKNMGDSQQLKIDVVAYPLMTAGGADLLRKYRNLDGRYENHLKIGGYKIILDGSPQGRSAWMSEPYLEGEEGYCGYPAFDDETLKKYVLQAVEERKQLLAHCNGDAAAEQFLKTYESCMASVGRGADLRPVMIHCQTVRKDQLERMAEIRMIASMFVGHVWYWGDVHVKNLGRERGQRISPVRDAIDRGVIVNFHQDTPVTKPNMLHSVWCASNRVSRSGQVVGEEQKVTVYEALKAVTINGAYQYFEENEKGSIEEGKRADLVILDRSPLETEVSEIKDIQVLETMKDGMTIYRK